MTRYVRRPAGNFTEPQPYLNELEQAIMQEFKLIKSELLEVHKNLNEFRQYVGADFEVVGLRFDRIEDRFDRVESSIIYEH